MNHELAPSLTQRLRQPRRWSGDPTLFSRQSTSGSKDLSYGQCWRIVDAHRRWLRWTIDGQVERAISANGGAAANVDISDVVVGYLSENSPDLLLSMLACMDMTVADALDVEVLPAAINVRWTSPEMERALRPPPSPGDSKGIHVTIVLYGRGHGIVASDAAWLMSRQTNIKRGDGTGGTAGHFAVAMPLPELSCEYYHEDIDQYSGDDDDDDRPESQDATTAISDADALVLFTSGTSSPNGAKGVRLSHRSLLVQARAKTHEPCQYNNQTKVVATTVPWYHVGGMSSVLAVVLAGGSLVFPPEVGDWEGAGFRPGAVLRSLRPRSSASVAANTLVAVPAMLHAMAEYARTHGPHGQCPSSFPNAKLVLVGGQSIGDGKLLRRARELFPGARIVQTYACTEAGSSVTFEDLGWKGDGKGDGDAGGTGGPDGAMCVGSPPPHVQIGIFDARGVGISAPPRTLPRGQMGVIGTRGPHVMSGYWNRGSDNATPIDPCGGWMLTNDLGYVHPRSGRLFFCGRADDVIRTGGESVLAGEVERALVTNGDIMECAVFALPDERFGEAVCVALVTEKSRTCVRDGDAVEDARWTKALRWQCAELQIAGFKRPRRAFRVRSLPRNSSGKVLKHVVIKLCASCSKERSCL